MRQYLRRLRRSYRRAGVSRSTRRSLIRRYRKAGRHHSRRYLH